MAAAIPFIMVGLSVVSTAVGFISSLQAGKAEEKAAERAAAQTRAAAERKAEDTRKQHQRIIAAQKAKYGYAGLTTEGTPLLVQMESIKESEEQLRRILEGGEMEAEAYEEAGERAATSGQIGGVKALLSGAQSFAQVGKTYATPGKTMFNWW